MTRLRRLLGLLAVLAALGLLAPQLAAADTVSDAVTGLTSANLYVGDSDAKLDKDTVTAALAANVKIAVLPASAGDATSLANQIGRQLDPNSTSKLVIGVFAGRSFSAASSAYCSGYASSQAKAAVNAHKSALQAGGDHPDLTATIQDFASRVRTGPALGSSSCSGSGSGSGSDTASGSSSSGTSAWPWLVGLGVVAGGGIGGYVFYSKRKRNRDLAAARANVDPYYDRLANELNTLDPKDNAIARQALGDAAERFTSAGSQLSTANTVQQYGLARRTVLEGLYAARTARTALGIDPGPELPPVSESTAPQLAEAAPVTVQGQTFQGYPAYTPGAPYYYGGGGGVMGGWYSSPFWETLLIGSVLTGGLGGFGGGGYNSGFDSGYDRGYDAGQDSNNNQSGGSDWGSGGGGGSDWGGGGGDWGGGGGGGGDSGGSW
jgi:hypothetical protein